MKGQYQEYRDTDMYTFVVMDLDESNGVFTVDALWDGKKYTGTIEKVVITETDRQEHTRVVACVGKVSRSFPWTKYEVWIFVGECELHVEGIEYYSNEFIQGVCSSN